MANYRRVYRPGGSVFITMVTHRRIPILISNIELLRRSFALSRTRYEYSIDAVVVLPDHIHMIITPYEIDMYPKIIAHIKRSFVYGLDRETIQKAKMTLSRSAYRRQLSGIWQKRFYEHTIRNEKDWEEKMAYIRSNPVKHGLVDRWDEWRYSSFVKPMHNR